MIVLDVIFFLIFGLVLGSFSTALVYRVPRGIPWAFQKNQDEINSSEMSAHCSACPHCKARLGVVDLVPVFSWLFMKGKCRHCGESIDSSYLWIEVGCVLAALAAFVALGWSLPVFWVLCVLPFLMALLVIDLRHMILPNSLVAIVGAFGVLRLACFAVFGDVPNLQFIVTEYALAALLYGGCVWVGGALMSRLLQKDALGFGDVKFFAVAGGWLGLSNFPLFLMFSGLLGVIFALVWQRARPGQAFPFGPALIISFYLLVLWGDVLQKLIFF